MAQKTVGSNFPASFRTMWPPSSASDSHDLCEQLVGGAFQEASHRWHQHEPGKTERVRVSAATKRSARIADLETEMSSFKHDIGELKGLILALIARLPVSSTTEYPDSADPPPVLTTPQDRTKIERLSSSTEEA